VRPADPALVHERFVAFVARARVRADARHRAHLDRLRARRPTDDGPRGTRLADHHPRARR
jgi:hypothetical protein